MAARAALVSVRTVKLLSQNSGPEQTTSFTKTTELFELAAWNSQQTINTSLRLWMELTVVLSLPILSGSTREQD